MELNEERKDSVEACAGRVTLDSRVSTCLVFLTRAD